jgi:hypothetical protein
MRSGRKFSGSRSHTLGAALVRRARIVVHARGGLKAEEIASRMDLCGNTVRYWINRFTERGLDALEEDVRTGRPPTSACCTEGFCQISGQLAESATTAGRFPGHVSRDRENHHELPALPLVVDQRAGGANGSWLPALPVPGVRAAVQRADRHGAEPGPGADRHHVSRGFLEVALQAEPARLAEMFLIRGIVFTHEAVRDWELAPLLAEGLRKRRAGKAGRWGHIDET